MPTGQKHRFAIDLPLMLIDRLQILTVGSNRREKQPGLFHHKLRRIPAQIYGIILRSYLLQKRMEVAQKISKHIPGTPRGMRMRPDPAEMRPRSEGNRPDPAECRPLSAEKHSSSAESRPVSVEIRPWFAEMRPDIAEIRPVSAEKRLALAESRPVSAEICPDHAGKCPGIEEMRPMSAEKRPDPAHIFIGLLLEQSWLIQKTNPIKIIKVDALQRRS